MFINPPTQLLTMQEAVEKFKKLMDNMERSLFFNPGDDIYDIFTEKRLEIVREIRQSNPSSIRDLAEKLERDIKNVYEDLNILSRHHIVSFEIIGRRKRPMAKKDLIIIRLR